MSSAILDHALAAHDAGLCVVKIKEKEKRPDGRWKQWQSTRPTPDLLRRWLGNGANGFGIVCGQVSGGLELLEFEVEAVQEGVLDAFIAAAEDTGLGDLVNTLVTSFCVESGSGGIHVVYRCPDLGGNTKLASRPPTDAELVKDPTCKKVGLIETRGEGGFFVGPHSVLAGKHYKVLAGTFATIATISAAEHQALHALARTFDRMPTKPKPATIAPPTHTPRPATGDTLLDRFDRDHTGDEILERNGFTFHHADASGRHYTRPGKDTTGGSSATIYADTGTTTLFSTSIGVDDEFIGSRKLRPSQLACALEHGGDFAAMTKSLGEAERQSVDDWVASLGDDHHQDDDQHQHGDLRGVAVGRLPDEFWTAHPALTHVRQAAWNRLVSPEAVLAAVLARVVACSPHTIELPAIVGRWGGLSILAAIVGPSNVGKSASAGVASELIEAPPTLNLADQMPIGSGEGLAEMLMGIVDEDDGTGKTRKVKRQVRHNAFVTVDEGQVLGDLASRSGSTLAPTIRSIFSHQTIGQANASADRTRIIAGTNYTFGIVLGIQPDKAGPLIDDAGGGTPQRFVWATALAERPPDVDDPGPLDWSPPTPTDIAEASTITRGGFRRAVVEVEATVANEIREAHLAALDGTGKLPEHHNLRRLKVAAALALLTGPRLEVTAHDWHLAGTVMDASTDVYQSVVDHLAAVEAVKHNEADRRFIDRNAKAKVAEMNVAEAKALASASRSVGRVVHKHSTSSCTGGCTRRCLTQAVASKHRQVVPIDDIIQAAITNGWIVASDEGFHPGESRPA